MYEGMRGSMHGVKKVKIPPRKLAIRGRRKNTSCRNSIGLPGVFCAEFYMFGMFTSFFGLNTLLVIFYY